ncbi:hypothetical protein LCGC14_0442640 [marine sediment metagenome]|uniref:Uncharacterized protein n=1 Tax=marine sediment metagenome TaxID=412755 RepID=A0A0F9SQW2_9ZZZZ
MSISYSKVSNKDVSLYVNLAGTKIRNRRLSRPITLDITREIGDNKIIELGL